MNITTVVFYSEVYPLHKTVQAILKKKKKIVILIVIEKRKQYI